MSCSILCMILPSLPGKWLTDLTLPARGLEYLFCELQRRHVRFSVVDVKPVAGHRSWGREKTNPVCGGPLHTWILASKEGVCKKRTLLKTWSKNSFSKQRQPRHNRIGSEIRISGRRSHYCPRGFWDVSELFSLVILISSVLCVRHPENQADSKQE